MRIQQLIYFEKIAEKGSMNEAAKELYVSQPSLSKAIRELEIEMDITLFNVEIRELLWRQKDENF